MDNISKKIDLRTRQTYSFLTAALLELMESQSFDDITVKDICEKANVHRTTFYKHFEDKHNLLKIALVEVQKEFDRKCKNLQVNYLDQQQFYFQIFRSILEYIAENKKFFMGNIFGNGDSYITKVFQSSIVIYISEHLKKSCQENSITFKVPITIMAEYYSGAAISLINWWIENNMVISIDEMTKTLEIIYSGNLT